MVRIGERTILRIRGTLQRFRGGYRWDDRKLKSQWKRACVVSGSLTFLPRVHCLQPIEKTAIVAERRRAEEEEEHHSVELSQLRLFPERKW